jgi:DNA helicase-2/ATP-dependent DNA helicase PcrA
MLFGQVKFNGPSRFLDEIPEKLFTWKKLKNAPRTEEFNPSWKQKSKYGDTFDPYDQSQETNYDNEEVVYQVKTPIKESYHQPKFPKGSKVVHSLYGAGKVDESEGSGPDEKVLIRFVDGTRKKFMVKFAPIVLSCL